MWKARAAGCSKMQSLTLEPALALYMFTTFVKYPVFQSLLYEKSCIARYKDESLCQNVSHVHSDIALQKDANALFLLSSLCLLLPSIPASLLLGSLCDIWKAKIPILIPLVGVILGDVNYVIQCIFFTTDPHWLLISDLIFGILGGYSAVIGTMLSCTMKRMENSRKGRRMALLEGSIGIGTTFGFALSGIIRQSLGYSRTFLVLMILRIICFLYVVFFVDEIEPADSNGTASQPSRFRVLRALVRRMVDAWDVIIRARPSQRILLLTLVAFAIELLAFAGVNDIQYSFYRFKLQWGDKEYGWYSGLCYALSTLTVLLAYPWLRSLGVRDLMLCVVALITKIINLFITGFVFCTWFAYAVTPLSALNRFISTALRTTASQSVDLSEQGKVFSVMSLLDGVVSLAASFIFNSLYPLTLPDLSFLCFIGVAFLLFVPLIISCILLYWKASDTPSTSTGSLNAET